MSNLLSQGFTAIEIADILSKAAIIKEVKLINSSSVNHAADTWDMLLHLLVKKLKSSNIATINKFCNEHLGITLGKCEYSGNTIPQCLIVKLPNGKSVLAARLFRGGFEYSYDDGGNIVRSSMLYGDRDILPYSTDPLTYLKFRCLDTEQLKYSTKEDEFVNSEYSGVAPVFLGIELEVEKRHDTPAKIEHMVANDLGMDYMILKSDGSLRDGFEIVTAPATIGFHLKAWEKFFANSAKHVSSWTSSRCGMHVHISRAALTPMHLGKLIAFINNNENRDFITSIAGRNSSYSKYVEDRSFHVKSKLISYIERSTKELKTTTDETQKRTLSAGIVSAKLKLSQMPKNADCSKLLRDIEFGGERMSAVNLTKKGTVEIRIFRGNVSKIGMLKNLEFCHAAVQFTREATFRTSALTPAEAAERALKRKENTDYALHYTYFLDWLNKDTTGNYNNLKLWLQTAKLTDKFSKKKVSSKAPPDKHITDDDVRACA